MENSQTFILQEVIDELLKPEVSLMGPLLKLNYFGRHTENALLVEFTNREMNGYNAVDPKSFLSNWRKVNGFLMKTENVHLFPIVNIKEINDCS